MIYESLKLPDYFVRILSSEYQNSSDSHERLASYVNSNTSLYALVSKYFKEIDPDLRLDLIIKKLGVVGFRDKMASVFLYYIAHGNFPVQIDESIISEVIKFENGLDTYEYGDRSLIFMLGLYLQGLRIKSPDIYPSLNVQLDELLPFISLFKSRVIRVDILIFTVIVLKALMPKHILTSNISSRMSFNEIFELLDNKKKKEFIESLINYGYSINYEELFFYQKI